MRPAPLSALLLALSILSVAFGGLGVAEESRAAASADEAGATGGGDALLGGELDVGQLQPARGLRFGIDAEAVGQFRDRLGTSPDYATVWVGKWNLDSGWLGTDRQVAAIREAGVTPAIHFYYWGDDISKDCLNYGCKGKDLVGWQRLADELVQHLHSTVRGAEAVIILESEYNKHGVHEDETLDAMLAEKAQFIKMGYTPAKVVLGLGNWYPEAWDTWDQAAAACDYVGLQALGGTTKDDEGHVRGLFNNTLEGAKRLKAMYGKPIFVQDVAVSSYPEPENLDLQQEALARFARGLPQLQEAGVEAVVYRSFLDVPDMALSNHYVEAERHWGLAWHDTGELKPGGEAWVAAIQKAKDVPVEFGKDKDDGKGKEGRGDEAKEEKGGDGGDGGQGQGGEGRSQGNGSGNDGAGGGEPEGTGAGSGDGSGNGPDRGDGTE